MEIIKNKSEFEELLEKIKENISWYECKKFNNVIYNLFMDNGKTLRIHFNNASLAHILGVNTEYLKSTRMFNDVSYELLKQVSNNSYRLYTMIKEGHLTYNNFLSEFICEKLDTFKHIYGIDLYNIEFICKYDKTKSYTTGNKEQTSDYYIAYRNNDLGLYIIGLKNNGEYYYPMTNLYIDFSKEEGIKLLKSLLENQQITMPRGTILYYLDTNGKSKPMYIDYQKKTELIRTLESYSKKYNVNIDVLDGYNYSNEKVIKLLNSASLNSKIYEKIFVKVIKRTFIDIKSLEKEFGELPENIIRHIQEYNNSLTESIDSALDEHTKEVITERDNLKKDNIKHLEELKQLKKELLASSKIIESLQQENGMYEDKINQMKKILSI